MMIDFSVKEAARILGVHLDTLKYWEEKNLIPQPRRNKKNNYRVYNIIELKEIAKLRGIYDVEIDSAVRAVTSSL